MEQVSIAGGHFSNVPERGCDAEPACDYRQVEYDEGRSYVVAPLGDGFLRPSEIQGLSFRLTVCKG